MKDTDLIHSTHDRAAVAAAILALATAIAIDVKQGLGPCMFAHEAMHRARQLMDVARLIKAAAIVHPPSAPRMRR